MSRPFVLEITYNDPAKLFAPLANEPYAVFLDSAQQDGKQGRYSFICAAPKETIAPTPTLFGDLKKQLQTNPQETIANLPPFQGGLCGYFGYELLHLIEDVRAQQKDSLSVPDVALGLYLTVCAFDHHKQKAWIISHEGKKAALELYDRLHDGHPTAPYTPQSMDWQTQYSRDEYEKTVQHVIDYICQGDIFQANLTQRFSATLPDGFDRYAFYNNLRRINPAPFSAYLNYPDVTIASSSPERFIALKDMQVETCPIKGTMPRSEDPVEDAKIAEHLYQSEKDRAENTMIVDLLRNDLSRVCQPFSVDVPELCAVHPFASVHHLVSTITGTLVPGKTAIDLLEATFPGGSITGAPKVRAMEIISELERCRRGPYCGAIGYVGFDGTMDTNIVIRTLIFKDKQVGLQVGGGIVADSIPSAEYQETLDKAAALFKAFEQGAP